MNPTEFQRVVADICDVRTPAAKAKPRLGDHDVELTINGVDITCTYDLEGHHYAATETDPEEFPCVELVSVDFGAGPIFGADAREWDDTLNLTTLIEEQAP